MNPALQLDRATLEAICRQFGADDVGFADLEGEALAAQRASVAHALPWARTVMVFVRRMNRHPIRTPFRTLASAEFIEAAHDVKTIIHRTVRELEDRGVRTVGISGLFPMEFGRTDGMRFVLQLKYLAEAAGLGTMGKHRLVIHPRFGPDIYLGAILLEGTVETFDRPLAASPCLDCNLCAASCPTGAIASDGHFDAGSCMTHNYREKGTGFVEWIHTLADSRNRDDYRARVSDAETLSWWQSLGYEANTHCDYCVAVCPAGDEAIGFLKDRKGHVRDVVAPLRERVEPVYVVAGSDAEDHVARKFPHKTVRRIGSGRTPKSIAEMLGALPMAFQRGRAEGVEACFHFRFRGGEALEATVEIHDQKLAVRPGLVGHADLTVRADSEAWLGLLARQRSLGWERLRGRVKLEGPPGLLEAFQRCFPS